MWGGIDVMETLRQAQGSACGRNPTRLHREDRCRVWAVISFSDKIESIMPISPIYSKTFTIPANALDKNGHVNNVAYVQWMHAESALP